MLGARANPPRNSKCSSAIRRSPCGVAAVARCQSRSCWPTVVAGSQTPGRTPGYRSAYSGRSRASRTLSCTRSSLDVRSSSGNRGRSSIMVAHIAAPARVLLSHPRRRSQVVRQRSAKPPSVGSIPTGASRPYNDLRAPRLGARFSFGKLFGKVRRSLVDSSEKDCGRCRRVY
jgi:hypothetical protein